jgi:DNA-binding MarR family transcriptional regulator
MEHQQPPSGEPLPSIAQLIMDTLPVTIRVMAAQMRDSKHGLTLGHLPVLAALDDQPFTQHQLALMMSVSGATMSNTLSTLEARGWIARQRSQDDRRLVHTHLTDAGRAVLRESLEEMEVQIGTMLQGLDDTQRQKLVEGLLVLHDIYYRALGVIEQAERGT